MTEGNGGTLSVGQRLGRIESRLDTIENHLDARITRHKEANEAHLKELATTIVTDFGKRISEIEKKEVADAAATAALDAVRNKAESNKRWIVGSLISLGILLLAVLGLLFQLQGRVG